MYAIPETVPADRSMASKTALPMIVAICCGATMLLLLATTIVLALIPVYLPAKSVTPATSRSNQVSTYIPLGDANKRRQTTSSLSSAINGVIDDTEAESNVKPKLLKIFQKTKKVKSIINLACTVVLISSGRRRRRYALTKRQGSSQIALRCTYYIVYPDDCRSLKCQGDAGDLIRSQVQKDTDILTVFQFDSLVITINGVRRGFRCRAIGLAIVSIIRAGATSLLESIAVIQPTVTASNSGAGQQTTVAPENPQPVAITVTEPSPTGPTG